jgi:hypothetical protein
MYKVYRKLETAGRVGGGSAAAGDGGSTGNAQGERIWSSLERQKVLRGLLVIHILWSQG